jgi:hypothetical protein
LRTLKREAKSPFISFLSTVNRRWPRQADRLVSAGSALADPKGLWLAQDGAHVRVGPCGAALCATIAKPKSSVDPQTGVP